MVWPWNISSTEYQTELYQCPLAESDYFGKEPASQFKAVSETLKLLRV